MFTKVLPPVVLSLLRSSCPFWYLGNGDVAEQVELDRQEPLSVVWHFCTRAPRVGKGKLTATVL